MDDPRSRHVAHVSNHANASEGKAGRFAKGERMSGRTHAPSHSLPQVDMNPGPIATGGHSRARSRAASLAQMRRSKRRARAIGIGAVVIIVTIVVAFLVGTRVFLKTTDANFEDEASNAAEALAPSTDEPIIFLLEADLSFGDRAEESDHAYGFMLARLDTEGNKLSFLTIPGRLQVEVSSGEVVALEDARDYGGDAETIRVVSDLADLKVNHFVSTNAQGLSRLVDAVGGVEIEILTEIDDPQAGNIVIPPGVHTLKGEEALVYLRNTNSPRGFEQTAQDRVGFTFRLLARALDTQGFDFANIISEASNYVSTDMSTSYLMDLANAARPLSDLAVFESIVPFVDIKEDGRTVHQLNSKEWSAVLDAFVKGGDTGAINDSAIPPSEVSVEIRNGANIDGAGARLGTILRGFGYPVDAIGNTNDGTIYPETLVIYTDSIYAGAAQDIVSEISSGRVVNGGDYYSSNSDVIVIIGSDWSATD